MDTERPGIELEHLLAHAGWLRGLARSLVGDPALADDLSQQTWLAALNKPPADARNLKGWLARTLKNALRQSVRSGRQRALREQGREQPPALDPAELVQRVETQRMLAAEVLRLAEPYRSTLIRRYYEGLSAAEIARQEGVPAGTVRWRLHEALSELRRRLDAGVGGDRRTWIVALSPIAGLEGATAGGAIAAAAFAQSVLTMKLSTKIAWTAAVLIAVAGLGTLPVLRVDEHGGATQEPASARLEGAPVVLAGNAAAATASQDESARAPVATPETPRVRASGTLVDLPYPGVGGTATPAAGVDIEGRLTTNRVHPETPRSRVMRADAAGRFELDWEDPGVRPLYLSVSTQADAAYRATFQSLQFAPDVSVLSDLRVERAAHGDLMGQTVTSDGTPLPGVLVSLGLPMVTEKRLEILSDGDGRFAFERFPFADFGGIEIAADKEGYVLSDATPVRKRKEGGFEFLRVVLTKDGKLSVRVLDSAGDPVEGANVGVTISKAERERQRQTLGSAWRVPSSGKSDADGRVDLESIWAGKKLRVSVSHGAAVCNGERVRDGRLVGGPAHAGSQAIVVPPGSRLDLIASLPETWETCRIHGRVLFADDTPAANARVRLYGAEPGFEVLLLSYPKTDGQGCFELPTPGDLGRILIAATEGDLPDGSSPTAPRAVCQPLDLTGRAGTDVYVELLLQPTLAITGTVRTAAGEPCRGRIRAVAQATTGPGSGEPLASGDAALEKDGSFRIDRLRPGRYDLLVEPAEHAVFTANLARQRFPGIEAGRSDLELRLVEQDLVHVAVEAIASEGSVSSMTVLIGKHNPSSPIGMGSAPAREQLFHSRDGWPASATLALGHGQSFARDAGGTTEFLHYGATGASYALPAFEEGWYWIGVRTFGAKGCAYSPTGTGLVYLSPGSYAFRFALDPTVNVEGRLVSPKLDPDLCVALADDSGRLVPLHRATKLDPVIEVGAAGDFVLEAAPIGAFSLRIGTDSDLRSGRSLREQPIEIMAQDNRPLRIEIP